MKNILLFTSFVFILFSCTKTQGDVSITYEKANAVYGDLEAVRALPLITTQKQLVNPGKVFVGENYILIGEEGQGIHIFDNANMTNPIRLSFIQIPYNREFYIKDGVLYAETLYDFIKVDISDVYNPELISRALNVFGTPYENDKGESLLSFNYQIATDVFELNSPEAKEIEREGKLHLDYLDNVIPESTIPSSFATTSIGSGSINRIAVDFNHIYVLGGNTLHVLSDNGFSMTHENDIKLDDGMETIYSENNRLYIGSETAMLTYSVNNPSRPSRVSTFDHTESCDPVLPIGTNLAYMTLRSVGNEGCNANGENTLTVIDLAVEQEPQSLQVIEMESPYGMAMLGWYLIVGEGTNGITVFDASNPRNLVELARITGVEAYDIMRHPSDPYVLMTTSSDGLEQYQIDYNTFVLTPLSTVTYPN
jgi:hypothetical protein